MKRFRFRLEQLLEIRRKEEQEWEIRLARISGECLRLKTSMEENRREVRERRVNRSSGGTGGPLSLEHLQILEEYTRRLLWQADQYQADLLVKEQEREKVREGYLKAARARKGLDKLKEKREKEYYDKIIYEEQKSVDEMNSAAAARRINLSHRV